MGIVDLDVLSHWDSFLVCRDPWVPHTSPFLMILVSSSMKIFLENSEAFPAHTIKFPSTITNRNTRAGRGESDGCSSTVLINNSSSFSLVQGTTFSRKPPLLCQPSRSSPNHYLAYTVGLLFLTFSPILSISFSPLSISKSCQSDCRSLQGESHTSILEFPCATLWITAIKRCPRNTGGGRGGWYRSVSVPH